MTTTRRGFLKNASAAFAVPMFVPHLISAPPSGKVRHASFGASGMAGADLGSIASHGSVEVRAICDVDSSRLDGQRKRFGESARFYGDYRQLLDKEGRNLDSCNVSTPDHMHAPIALAAMQLGINVYVQKPLAHNIYEVRQLTEAARAKKLVSQMGIQVHSAAPYQLAIRVIQDGAIGKVKEVHTWSNKKWGDDRPRPEDRKDPVPANLNWDLWLGVAEERPFIGGYYHPGEWRKRLDFGTGTFGDMGCHIYDPVFAALACTAPISVRSDGPTPGRHNWANNAVIRYVFPATRFTDGDTFPITWYDGDQKPSLEVQKLIAPHKLPGQGSLLIGTRGMMLLPHVANPILLPDADFKDFRMPMVQSANHYHQFIDAVLGKGTPSAGFDYSGPLTETVLLGGVATHFPKTTLEWDSAKLTFKKNEDATRLVRRTYRKGWELPVVRG